MCGGVVVMDARCLYMSCGDVLPKPGMSGVGDALNNASILTISTSSGILRYPKGWSTTNVADEPMGSISHEVVDCGNKLSVEGIV